MGRRTASLRGDIGTGKKRNTLIIACFLTKDNLEEDKGLKGQLIDVITDLVSSGGSICLQTEGSILVLLYSSICPSPWRVDGSPQFQVHSGADDPFLSFPLPLSVY